MADPFWTDDLIASVTLWRKNMNAYGAFLIATRGIEKTDQWKLIQIEFDSVNDADKNFEKFRKKLVSGITALVAPNDSIRSIVGHHP